MPLPRVYKLREFNRRNDVRVKSLILKRFFVGFEFKPEFDGLDSSFLDRRTPRLRRRRKILHLI
jgi:hypothetical protein